MLPIWRIVFCRSDMKDIFTVENPGNNSKKVDVVQGLSNMIQHDQTRCPNRKMPDHQISGSCLMPTEHFPFGQGF